MMRTSLGGGGGAGRGGGGSEGMFLFLFLRRARSRMNLRGRKSHFLDSFPRSFGRRFEYKADEKKSRASVRSLMQQHLRGLNQANSHDKMELSLKHTF